MSLKKLFFKTGYSYKIYLYYNLYIRNKGFFSREQFSQWGEDIEIRKFFKDTDKGIYLDAGCFHPLMFSNTALLYKKGWSGINIDMNPTSIDLFNIARPNDTNICTAISDEEKDFKMYYDGPFSSVNTIDEDFYKMSQSVYFKNKKILTVKTKTINQVIKIAKIENYIDFLNIDVEGFDFKILKQINLNQINIKLIAIETHHVDGSQTKDCSLIFEFLNRFNFSLYKRIGPTTLFNNNN